MLETQHVVGCSALFASSALPVQFPAESHRQRPRGEEQPGSCHRSGRAAATDHYLARVVLPGPPTTEQDPLSSRHRRRIARGSRTKRSSGSTRNCGAHINWPLSVKATGAANRLNRQASLALTIHAPRQITPSKLTDCWCPLGSDSVPAQSWHRSAETRVATTARRMEEQ